MSPERKGRGSSSRRLAVVRVRFRTIPDCLAYPSQSKIVILYVIKIVKTYETNANFYVTVGGMPTTEISVSEARSQFRDLIEAINETGPITLVRNSKRVAEIRPITEPSQELLSYLDLFEDVGGMENANELMSLGVHTYERMREFIRLSAELGLDLSQSYYDGEAAGDCTPDTAVEEIAAILYLGGGAPSIKEAGQSLIGWARVLSSLLSEARKKNTYARLEFEEEEVMAEILATGLSPENFHANALRLLAQDVQLGDVPSALGEEAIPVDILAMGAGRTLHDLVDYGMSREDAVQLLRNAGNDFRDTAKAAKGLMAAGVSSYEEIARLQEKKVPLPLARRAHAAGLAPAEWEEALTLLSRYSYGGEGLLPFDVLLKAAHQGVSVTHWDKNNIVADPKLNTYNRNAAEESLSKFPWVQIYPNRVVELAELGVTPGYVDALTRLMLGKSSGWNFTTEGDVLVVQIKEFYQAGLKLPIIKVMARAERGRLQFTPTHEELLELARLGVTEPEARHLAEFTNDPQKWIAEVRKYHAGQAEVAAWVEDRRTRQDWQILTALSECFRALHNPKYRWHQQDALLMDGVERVLKGDQLSLGHLLMLEGNLRWYLDEEQNKEATAKQFRQAVNREQAHQLLDNMGTFVQEFTTDDH